MSVEPSFKIASLRSIHRSVQKEEKLTALRATATHLIVGTSSGSIAVFDHDGCLIIQRSGVHHGPIRCLDAQGFLVVSGGSDGKIMINNWYTDEVMDFGKVSSEDEVTSLFLPEDFHLNSEYLHFGTRSGRVIRRTRGMLMGFSDHVLYDLGKEKEMSGMRKQWKLYKDDLKEEEEEEEEEEERDDDDDYVIGSRQKMGGVMAVSSLASFEGSLLLAVCPRFAIVIDMNRRKVVGKFHTRASFRNPFCASMSRNHFYASCGKLLYQCTRDFEKGSLIVENHYELPSNIVGISCLDQYVICVLSIPDHEYMIVVLRESVSRSMLVLVHSIPLVNIDPLIKRSTFSFATERMRPMCDGSFVDPVSPQSLLQSHRFLEDFVQWRLYLVFDAHVVEIRPSRIGEFALFLTMDEKFLDALELFRRDRSRMGSLVEISDLYASSLWKRGEKKEAISVWAAYVLPVANARFWSAFFERMEKNDSLILIEEHLPFYDRTLLPPEAYYRVLLKYIKDFKYRDFYDRIKRWRVLYPIDDMIEAVWEETIEARQAKGDVGMSPKVVRSVARKPLPFSVSSQRSRVDRTPKETKERQQSHIKYLLLALHKLYEFKSEHICALRLLLWTEPEKCVDYLRAFKLWTFFHPPGLLDGHLSETLLRDMHFLFPKAGSTIASPDGSYNDLSMAQKMLLLDLVDATGGDILGELAQRLTECPMEYVLHILKNDDLVRLAYLENCIKTAFLVSSMFHDEFVQLSFDFLFKDVVEVVDVEASLDDISAQKCGLTHKRIHVLSRESLLQTFHRVLQTSPSMNVDKARKLCIEYSYEEGNSLLDDRKVRDILPKDRQRSVPVRQ